MVGSTGLEPVTPAVHPHCSGAQGKGHGADYHIVDKHLACLVPAQCLAATVGKLLENDAALGRAVVKNASLRFPSKQAYLEAIDKLAMNIDAVQYNGDGSVTLKTKA